jgi:hypothetical protein
MTTKPGRDAVAGEFQAHSQTRTREPRVPTRPSVESTQ